MNRLYIFGTIGGDVTPEQVADTLNGFTGPVEVDIHSGGGSSSDGMAIMNMLRDYDGEVTGIVTGLAASAASVIAVGGCDRLIMRPGSELMIHAAWCEPSGNAVELRRSADDLERVDRAIAGVYAAKAGGNPEQWLERMAEETWYSADEAVSAGLADEVTTAGVKAPSHAYASITPQHARYRSRAEAPAPTTKEKPLSILDELANAIGVSPEELTERLAAVSEEQEQEQETAATVAYPEAVEATAGEVATIEPTEAEPEAVTATCDEDNVVVEVDGATVTVLAEEPGEVEVTITADDTEFTVTVTFNPVPEETGEEEEEETVTLPMSVYKEMVENLRKVENYLSAQASKSRTAEVDGWIADGRFSAAHRAAAIAAMESDPTAARSLWGALPKDSVPRAEIGSAREAIPESTVPTTAELRARAKSRRAHK